MVLVSLLSEKVRAYVHRTLGQGKDYSNTRPFPEAVGREPRANRLRIPVIYHRLFRGELTMETVTLRNGTVERTGYSEPFFQSPSYFVSVSAVTSVVAHIRSCFVLFVVLRFVFTNGD